ncbi:MAG: hypothetical protein II661_08020, partial [Bacteroidales bacterium]|nr:hypothetical protein [Bacteroidales bacterium]
VFDVDSTNNILSVKSPYSLKVLAGSVTASGNITAGGIAASDVVNGIYYRLDSWDNYDTSGGTTDDYVPRAKIVYDRLEELEAAIGQGSGGSSNVSFSPASGGVYGALIIDNGSPYNLLMYDATKPYLYKSVWDNVFTVDDTNHILNLNSPFSFKALNGSITASGNITAGTASADSELGAVYYRLDSWNDYAPGTVGYVPSAGIVYPMLSRIAAVEQAIEDGVGSVNDVSFVNTPTGMSISKSADDGYISFSISLDTGYSLLTATDKAHWDSIYNLFTVYDTYVELNVKQNESVRDFHVTGSIKATKNITAGAVASTEEIGDVLYRMDDWDDYDSTDQSDRESVPAMTLLDNVRNSVTLVANQVAALATTVDNLNLDTITTTLNTLVNTTIPNLTTSISVLEARNQFKYVGAGQQQSDYPAPAQMEEGVLYIKLTQSA